MNYRGHVRNGQIMLDRPAPLPEGAAVTVQVLQPGNGSGGGLFSRSEILQMPLNQRRQLLARQSERMLEHYDTSAERDEWQGGDILE